MKKSILAVIPRIPNPDSNAGDRRILRNLTILSEKYKLYVYVVVSKYKNKIYEDKIISFTEQLYFSNNTSFENIIENSQFESVFFEYWTDVEQFLPYLNNIKIIIDVHKLQYLEDYRGSKIHNQKKQDLKNKELSIYKKAALIITVTDFEKKILSELIDTHIEVVYPDVDIPIEVRNIRNRHSIAFVGYMKNIQNIDAVKYFINTIWPLIVEKYPDEKLYIIGSSPSPEILSLASKNIKITGQVREVDIYLNSMRVTVVPLRIGAGLKQKVLESLANGCPLVTTSIGAEDIDLIDGINAYISDEPEEFAAKVIDLLENDELWTSFAEKGRKLCIKKYQYESARKKMLDII